MQMQKMIIDTISGEIFNNTNDFNIDTSKEKVLSLTPKSRIVAKHIQKIEVTIADNYQTVSSLVITDPSGDTTSYTFSDIQFNSPINKLSKYFIVK